MSYTVARLHRELAKLIEQGHGRKPIQIDKATFRHNLEEDGATIMPVEIVDGPRWIAMADPDGGIKWNADGSESGRQVVVLKGDRR